MNEDIKIAFGEDGKAHVLNDEYCIYCADEKTLNKVKEAVEKQKKKKVVPFCSGNPVAMACPECGTFQDFADKEVLDNRSKYCYKCGQALDWSEADV